MSADECRVCRLLASEAFWFPFVVWLHRPITFDRALVACKQTAKMLSCPETKTEITEINGRCLEDEDDIHHP